MVNGSEKSSLLSWRCTLSQVLAVSVKNIVLLGYGMTLGFPTLLIPVLSGNDKNETFHLGLETISWIGSISLICVPFGCFFSGMLTDPFGRKKSMQFINIPFLASWLLFYFSSEIWHVFAALIITGLAGGLMEAPVLTYVAEISQPHLRGTLSSTSSMSVIGGVMIQFILATFLKWRTVALCSAVVPIISFTLLFFIPETPIWLISKRRYVEAKKSLTWLRGWVSEEEINEEYEQHFAHVQLSRGIGNAGFSSDVGKIHNNQYNSANTPNGNNFHTPKRTKMETLSLFKKRNFIVPFILVSYVFFLSHFNGLSPIQTYAVNIFNSLRTPLDKYYATALLGIVEVFGCITCVSLVRHFGKRLLSFVSLTLTACCFLIVGAYAHINSITTLMTFTNSNGTNSSEIALEIDGSTHYTWIPLTAIIAAAFFSHMGIRVLPWILTGEIFPNETRALAAGMSATSSYIFGFLCNKIFLSMVSTLTLPGTFWFFSAMSFLGLIVLYSALPETEGKTLQEITDHFSGKIKLGNNVTRRRTVLNGVENKGFDSHEKKVNIESKL